MVIHAVTNPSGESDNVGDHAAWLSFLRLEVIRSLARLSRWRLLSRVVAW